jgi:hypothetical protein
MSELRKSKNGAVPSSGATRPAGKPDRPDANLQFSDKTPETVKTLPVESDNQKHAEAVEAANAGNILFVTQSQEDGIRATRKALNKKSISK